MNRRTPALLATVALTAAVAVLVVAPGSALGSAARAASNSQTFTDSTGENPNAPDITSIAVSNDDAGNITFGVNIANRPQLTSDMLLLLFLNTDGNAQTGDPQSFGADYVIQLQAGEVDLFKWTGTTYGSSVATPSLTYSYATTGATIHVSAAALGKTKVISFVVEAVSGITTDSSGNPDFTNAQSDVAPDVGHGSYTYQVLTTLKLQTSLFATTPKPARSGGLFTASFAATENDTAGPVTAGSTACAATIAGKPVAAIRKGSVVNGVAACTWRLPKADKGKTIRGSITLTVQGVSVAKTFAAKIL
jgi:hypothetical protein